MKRTATGSALLPLLCTLCFAGLPVQDMSASSIAVDYTGLWRGETITEGEIAAHENAHHLDLRYAPVPYVAFSLGFGIAGYTVDTVRLTQFKGVPGPSLSFGLDLYSPRFFDILRVTCSAKGYYLYTRNKNKDYLYSGPFVTPGLGLNVTLAEKLDLEAGGRGVLIFGEMSRSSDPSALYFSNNNKVRGYLTLVLHSPYEGAYCVLDLDASPAAAMDWGNGLFESSISLSLGFILRTKNWRKGPSPQSTYPGYEKLKKKQDEMEQEMK
jgi:hypothetical protein